MDLAQSDIVFLAKGDDDGIQGTYCEGIGVDSQIFLLVSGDGFFRSRHHDVLAHPVALLFYLIEEALSNRTHIPRHRFTSARCQGCVLPLEIGSSGTLRRNEVCKRIFLRAAPVDFDEEAVSFCSTVFDVFAIFWFEIEEEEEDNKTWCFEGRLTTKPEDFAERENLKDAKSFGDWKELKVKFELIRKGLIYGFHGDSSKPLVDDHQLPHIKYMGNCTNWMFRSPMSLTSQR